jgi:mRNA-degrading endonuclease RelE of RelBE toxin-antitoxin system
MELEFNITRSFDEDIKELSTDHQNKIKDKINFVSGSLLNGKAAFMQEASMPHIFNLKGGLDSSLYLVRVDEDKKMIVTVDEDPIFDKVSLTLFRLVNHKDAEQVYKEVGEDLYKSIGVL